MNNIYTKLMKVRVDFHNLELKKSGHNKFAGFKYYELADFLIPATKLLQEANLCPIISFTNELAIMTLINGDNPEETMTFTSPMRDLSLKGCNEIQALGGVQTYLTRYLYIQLLNVVEGDSFDSTSGKDEQPKQKTLLTDKQINRLLFIGKKAGVSEELIKKSAKKDYNTDDLRELSKENYEELCNRLEAKSK